MKPISTRLHGVMDYVTGVTLLAAPSLLGLNPSSPTARVLRSAGSAHAAYSLLTDYELGVIRVLPMRGHLALDALGAVAVAGSPWLLGTAGGKQREWVPPVVFGLWELGAVALTDPGN